MFYHSQTLKVSPQNTERRIVNQLIDGQFYTNNLFRSFLFCGTRQKHTTNANPTHIYMASATFRRKLHLSKMSPCPDRYLNPSGWWLKMWTYSLVFYGLNLNIAVNIFEVMKFSTKHIFDEMSCIYLYDGILICICFDMLNAPVNKIPVTMGPSHLFLGIELMSSRLWKH